MRCESGDRGGSQSFQGRNIFDIDAIMVTANDALLPSEKLADPLREFRLPRGGFRAIRECAPCVVRKSR
jgi:hypothetical protein